MKEVRKIIFGTLGCSVIEDEDEIGYLIMFNTNILPFTVKEKCVFGRATRY